MCCRWILTVTGARDGRDGGAAVAMDIAQAGGVEATIAAMRGHRLHAKTQEYGARLLGMLAATASSCIAARKTVESAGTLLLVDQRRSGRTGAQGGGGWDYQSEAAEEPQGLGTTHREMLRFVGVGAVRAHGVEALLDAIATHTSREDGDETRPSDVVYFSCWALHELAALPIVDGEYDDVGDYDGESVGVLVGQVLRAPSPTTASTESEGRQAMRVIASRLSIGGAVGLSLAPRLAEWLSVLLSL
eukprot:COSAG05_NODE_1352_length_5112_cov_27.256533_2_plen_246_part_00